MQRAIPHLDENGTVVARPGKIMGIALNYHDHARETGRDAPTVQTWFSKASTAFNPGHGEVHLPRVSPKLDYEVELVAVIGRMARHVPEGRAMEVVAGLTVGCDYSVRDWQRATPTMLIGKSFDTHAALASQMVPVRDVSDLNEVRLRCWVNDELLQDGRAGDMVFSIAQQIAHLSKAMTLEPGDLIYTGTPAGVGVARNPQKFLKTGDVVRCEAEGLASLENRIVAEPEGMRIG